MKAAVVQGYGEPLKIEEVPVKVPGRSTEPCQGSKP